MEIAISNSPENDQLHRRIFSLAFPKLQKVKKVNDLDMQRRGIDYLIVVNNRIMKLESKIDYTDWNNLPFEIAQSANGSGWATSEQESDMFLFVKHQTKTSYFFHTDSMLSWFHQNKNKYQERSVPSTGARVVPVPLSTLEKVIPCRVVTY